MARSLPERAAARPAAALRRTAQRLLVTLPLVGALTSCDGGLGTAPSTVSLSPVSEISAVGEPIWFVLTNASDRTVTLSPCNDGRLLRWSGSGWRPVPRPAVLCTLGGPLAVGPGATSAPFAVRPVEVPEGFYRGRVVVAYDGPLRSVVSSAVEVR